MGVSRSQQSLNAIRADLGLPEAGSARERAVMNKVNKTGGNIALSEYSGNILGLQHVMDRGPSLQNGDWQKTKDICSAHYAVQRWGSGYMSGGVAYLTSVELGGGGGDSGHEWRQLGMVLEDGNYELTGTSFAEWDSSYRIIEHHTQIVCNENGFLVGRNTIAFDSIRKDVSSNGNTYTWNLAATGPITLSTSKPYVTLIGRNIAKSGGVFGTEHTHNWRNMRLTKI